MSSKGLKFVCESQHAVGAPGIKLLRVLRELVGSLVVHRAVGCHGIVAAALFIATGAQMPVVQQVGHCQVDAQRMTTA